MNHHQYFVYIVTNKSDNVLYIGVTNDLMRRVLEHKKKIYKGFSAKYGCDKLVYYEEFTYIQNAIDREKQLKAGSREKKITLINIKNPDWKDLSEGWYDQTLEY